MFSLGGVTKIKNSSSLIIGTCIFIAVKFLEVWLDVSLLIKYDVLEVTEPVTFPPLDSIKDLSSSLF